MAVIYIPPLLSDLHCWHFFLVLIYYQHLFPWSFHTLLDRYHTLRVPGYLHEWTIFNIEKQILGEQKPMSLPRLPLHRLLDVCWGRTMPSGPSTLGFLGTICCWLVVGFHIDMIGADFEIRHTYRKDGAIATRSHIFRALQTMSYTGVIAELS